MSFQRTITLLGLGLTALSACDDDDPKIETEPAVVNQSAVGVWQGTLSYTAGSTGSRSFTVIIAPNGRIASGISSSPGTTNGRIQTGTVTTSGSTLSGTGMSFAGTGFPFPAGGLGAPLTLGGTVAAQSTIGSGTYSAGGETANYSLTYQALTNRAASLVAVGGNYTVLPGIGTSGVLNSNNGVLFFTSTSCVGNGAIAVIDPSLNIYSWTLQVTANGVGTCTFPGSFEGLAYLSDTSAMSTNNVIVMFGSQPGAGALAASGFLFVGSK